MKTRLQGALSADECLSLHLAFLEDTIETCKLLPQTDVALYLASAGALPFSPSIAIQHQCDGNLGLRMQSAFDAELQKYEKVLIVGIDCPALSPEILKTAFDALDSSECVLGPAEDGGYYLVGLRKVRPEFFTGIAWSTPEVLKATLQKAPDAALLTTAYDVDEPASLERMIAEIGAGKLPHARHIRRWIQSKVPSPES